jgi:hypothetical protein
MTSKKMTGTEKLKPVAIRTDAPVAGGDLTRVHHYARASRADRTWAQYRSTFRLFADWCAERSLSPMPAASETLRAYVAWLADQVRTIATVNAYVAAIASAHSIAKEPFDRSAIKNDLKGIRKAEPQIETFPIRRSSYSGTPTVSATQPSSTSTLSAPGRRKTH